MVVAAREGSLCKKLRGKRKAPWGSGESQMQGLLRIARSVLPPHNLPCLGCC